MRTSLRVNGFLAESRALLSGGLSLHQYLLSCCSSLSPCRLRTQRATLHHRLLVSFHSPVRIHTTTLRRREPPRLRAYAPSDGGNFYVVAPSTCCFFHITTLSSPKPSYTPTSTSIHPATASSCSITISRHGASPPSLDVCLPAIVLRASRLLFRLGRGVCLSDCSVASSSTRTASGAFSPLGKAPAAWTAPSPAG